VEALLPGAGVIGRIDLVDLIDFVIALTVLEALALAAYHGRTGRGMAPRDFLPNLAAGLALMLALRAGLSAAGWPWVAAGLMAAGLLHAADLRARWRRTP
jgi:hypothetical protein